MEKLSKRIDEDAIKGIDNAIYALEKAKEKINSGEYNLGIAYFGMCARRLYRVDLGLSSSSVLRFAKKKNNWWENITKK